MKEMVEHVAQLVSDLLEAGCDLAAVRDGYVIEEPHDVGGRERVQRILSAFGPRLHLMREISDHIRSLGRVCDP